LRKNSIIIIGVILVWVLLYQLNIILFREFIINNFVHWIFIPQGVRIVAVIIFAELGVVGLFFGTLVTYFWNGFTIGNPLIVALISSINPYLAVNFSRYLLKLDSLFNQLSAEKLLIISLISALFNSAIHQFYFHMRINAKFANDAMVMFFGDFFGSLILLYCMSIAVKWIKFKYRTA
jgi:hypothetical protein